jgi:uncharacterized membrane protein required for colicin V production
MIDLGFVLLLMRRPVMISFLVKFTVIGFISRIWGFVLVCLSVFSVLSLSYTLLCLVLYREWYKSSIVYPLPFLGL